MNVGNPLMMMVRKILIDDFVAHPNKCGKLLPFGTHRSFQTNELINQSIKILIWIAKIGARRVFGLPKSTNFGGETHFSSLVLRFRPLRNIIQCRPWPLLNSTQFVFNSFHQIIDRNCGIKNEIYEKLWIFAGETWVFF